MSSYVLWLHLDVLQKNVAKPYKRQYNNTVICTSISPFDNSDDYLILLDETLQQTFHNPTDTRGLGSLRIELLLVFEADSLAYPFWGNTFRKEEWMGFKAMYTWLSNVKEQQWLWTYYKDIGNFWQDWWLWAPGVRLNINGVWVAW